jgi:hypothetical protein
LADRDWRGIGRCQVRLIVARVTGVRCATTACWTAGGRISGERWLPNLGLAEGLALRRKAKRRMLPSAWVARWRIPWVTTGSVLRTWIGLVRGPWIETGLRHGPSGWRAVEPGLAAALEKARRTVPWRDGCLRNVSLRNLSLGDRRNIGLSGRERVVERRLGTSLLPLRQALLRGARWLGMLGLLYSRRSPCRRVGRRLSWRISRARLSVSTSLGLCWVA